MPEKNTARLAVEPARSDRVELLEALRPLLAIARDDEERVVDPDGEPHHHEHVHDEEGELEALPDQRRQAQRDDDRDEREHDRNERGDERAEDHEQHDQRDADAEHLTALEIFLGDLVEVDVGRERPGDGGLEARLAVRAGDDVDQALDGRVGVVGEGERHGRRVPIGRDERLVAVGVVARRSARRRALRPARAEASTCARKAGSSTECSVERTTTTSSAPFRARHSLGDQKLRSLRLGRVRDVCLGRERVAEKGDDQHPGADKGGDPRADREPGPTRGPARQRACRKPPSHRKPPCPVVIAGGSRAEARRGSGPSRSLAVRLPRIFAGCG